MNRLCYGSYLPKYIQNKVTLACVLIKLIYNKCLIHIYTVVTGKLIQCFLIRKKILIFHPFLSLEHTVLTILPIKQMELQSAVEYEKFMGIFGSPFKSFGVLMTLKSGVIFVAICDLAFAVFEFIKGIMLVVVSYHWYYNSFMYYSTLLSVLINVANIPFAFIGIRGITKLNIDDLQVYYKWEIFELVVESTLGLIESVYEGNGRNDLFVRLIIAFVVIFVSGLITKAIWSTYIRLKFNETVLVMHGEEALILMQQQAINLANPKVITPGMPIYFSQPV